MAGLRIETRVSTEYFDISDPNLRGSNFGEVVSDGDGYYMHLRTPNGRRLTAQGRGDIVVADISRQGWEEVLRLVGSLGENTNMRDVRRALAETPLLTSVREKIQR